MRRRFVLGTGATALALGVAAIPAGSMASATPAPPIQFSGAITCAAAGSLTFATALTNGGSTDTAVTLRAKLTGCSGVGTTSNGITLTGGSLLASSSTTLANNCGAVLSGQTLPQITGTIKWTTSAGKAAQSTAFVANAAVFYNASSNSVTVYLPSSISSGSYAGETMRYAGLASNLTGLKLSGSCAAGGLKSLKFGIPGGTTTGSVSVGA